VTDFLETKRNEIIHRMRELQPAVDEYGRLQAADAALARLDRSFAATPVGAPRGRGPGRLRASVSSAREAQALALVRERPGIMTGELNAKMGIRSPYLYSLLPRLAKEGKVEKRRVGWYPKGP